MAKVDWPDAEKRTLIGKRIDRIDGPSKATGVAKYSYDINRPGMLWAKVVTSPYAHAEVTSIEGLGTPERMNEVQKAFVHHDAQQCGFCTPGFVVACTAFVRKHPNATAEQVRAGLGGNLCRCGTYAGMMLAVVDAAKKGVS